MYDLSRNLKRPESVCYGSNMTKSASRFPDPAPEAADPRGADVPTHDDREVSVREFLARGGRHGLTIEEMFPT